jgi:peptidylprolyl isomerase/peptidyl-prolyl cis-trans isomerase B (cyclophilin B)
MSKRNRRRTPGMQKRSPSGSQRRLNLAAWWWVGVLVVAVLLIGTTLWFTVGPGKPAAPTPTEFVKTEKESGSMPENPAERNNMYSAPPAMQIDPDKRYVATLETEKGDIVVELFADKAPKTVNNFVFLAREGFYDDTTFHRVIADFMAQAGDPTGTGRGDPGYRFEDEFHPDLKHDRPGILSMANSGANTNGSQFFITYGATPWLDAYDADGNLKNCARPDVSCHAVFGRVIEGLDALWDISIRDPATASAPGDRIETIRIEER